MNSFKVAKKSSESTTLEISSWDSRLQLLSLAPQGIPKLRELILELAVRGKLVAQNSNDEPTSILLKRIKSEKEKLKKSGILKLGKSYPEISKDEIKFSIPNSWSWCRFTDVCSYIQRGKGPEYVEKSEYPVISQKCVRWYGLDLTKVRYISDASLKKYDDIRFLKYNDILWNSTGTGTIGRACIVPKMENLKKLVADSHVTVIRPLVINSSYLWRWIQSPTIQNEIEGIASGSTNQIELSTTTVESHLLPLPPLEEQKRIVLKINELMSLCDKLECDIIKYNSMHEQLASALVEKALEF